MSSLRALSLKIVYWLNHFQLICSQTLFQDGVFGNLLFFYLQIYLSLVLHTMRFECPGSTMLVVQYRQYNIQRQKRSRIRSFKTVIVGYRITTRLLLLQNLKFIFNNVFHDLIDLLHKIQ